MKTSVRSALLALVAVGMWSVAGLAPARAPSSLRSDLEFLMEEEKLARDVYTALATQWGQRPFGNIAQAEQRHMESVRDLLSRKGMTPPPEGKAGVFRNPELQKLYKDLKKRGLTSRVEALRVGAGIEDRDIFDLDRMRQRTNDPEARALYGMLRSGSENHIRAFLRNLSREGLEYQPQHISRATLDAILR